MAEWLSNKKQARGSHRSSTSRILSQTNEAMEASREADAILAKLTQDKLDISVLWQKKIENEIEQADKFKDA